MQLILTDFPKHPITSERAFDDNLKRLNEDMEKLFPPPVTLYFSSFQKVIDDQNSTVTDFRNAAFTGCRLTILFVTL